MFRSLSQFCSRLGKRTRGPKSRAGVAPKQPARLSLEALEDRCVPTVAFVPRFGAESIITRGDEHLGNYNPIHLIFWGSAWNGDNSPAANAVKDAARRVLDSAYLSGLDQYCGCNVGAFLSSTAFDNGNPGMFTPKQLNAVVANAIHNTLPRADTGDTGGNRRIYVVVTPPGAQSASGGAGYNSWFKDSYEYLFTTHSVATPTIWVSTTNNPDDFTETFSHELADILTDPYGRGVRVRAGAQWKGAGDDQIADLEPEQYAYRLPNGVSVQPYWSERDQAFIVPDGNRQRSDLFPIWNANGTFSGQYTLSVRGDQIPGDANDKILINQTGSGGVQVTLNGEAVAFDLFVRDTTSSLIPEVRIDTLAGQNAVQVVAVPKNVKVSIDSRGNSDDTVTVGNGLLARIEGTVDVANSSGGTSLTVNDSADQAAANFGISSSSLSYQGRAIVTYHTVDAYGHGVASLEIHGSKGLTHFTVDSVSDQTPVTVIGNSDDIVDGPAAGRITFRERTVFDGGSGVVGRRRPARNLPELTYQEPGEDWWLAMPQPESRFDRLW